LWVEYRGGCTVTFRLDAFFKGQYLMASGVVIVFVIMCEKSYQILYTEAME
jgi:hypothetical protein